MYQVNDVSRYNKKILNAYLKGAALCAQKGYDLRKLAIEQMLDLGSVIVTRDLY